jgi:hypothetical protein
MKAIQIISQDLFDKIRSRFENLEMGNENGEVTIDPAEARFFDFDFIHENVQLGRISISLNDRGSLKVYYSQGLTEGQDDFIKKEWYEFLKEMRFFAMRRLLRFDTRDISKTNLDKNDYTYLSKQGTKDKDAMTMTESRWVKTTPKTSRAIKGTTEVIVRHTESMAETYPGARSRPAKISAIFIQNREGERYKYPFIHTAGALAMARHVDSGGVPHDPAGKAIVRMSEEIAKLSEFRKKVRVPTLNNEAMGIAERAIGRLNELKHRMKILGSARGYNEWIGEFQEQDYALQELDPVTLEDYKSKFTQASFNEDLMAYFPLIHSIMKETNTIDLESYVNQQNETEIKEQSSKDAFEEFEQWAEAIENGELEQTEVERLTAELPKLTLGPNGTVAFETLSDILNLDSEDEDVMELQNALEKLSQENPTDQEGLVLDVFKGWVMLKHPEWVDQLEPVLGPPEPKEEPAAEPATTEPAAAAPEQPTTQPVAESAKGQMVEKIAEIIKSRFNLSNETVAPFRGKEGILLDVEKACKEEFGDKMDEAMLGKIRHLAERYMEKLTDMWEEKHGKMAPGNHEEMEDIRRLAGLAK